MKLLARSAMIAHAMTATGLVIAATSSSFSTSSSSTTKKPVPAVSHRQVERSEVASVLHRLGLTPESLAAAGVAANQVELMGIAVQIRMQGRALGADITSLTARANRTAESATRPPSGNPADPPVDREVAQARADLDAELAESLAAATNVLDAAPRAALARISANTLRNGASESLPVQYRLVDRTPAQWVALRGALAAQRYATTRGTPLAAAASTIIGAADAEFATAEGSTALANNLAGVRAAWDGFFDE